SPSAKTSPAVSVQFVGAAPAPPGGRPCGPCSVSLGPDGAQATLSDGSPATGVRGSGAAVVITVSCRRTAPRIFRDPGPGEAWRGGAVRRLARALAGPNLR